MKKWLTVLMAIFLVLSPMTFIGCGEEDTSEDVGDAIEDVGEEMGEAAEEIGEAAEEAADEVN